MRNYFNISDDFFYIIKTILPQARSIKQISTGWTNFVFKVKSGRKSYIFRFPRNEFFSEALIKECRFCQEIYKKTSFFTPNLFIFYDKGRPFSFHEVLPGKPLSKCKLSFKQKKAFAKDVCKFLKELSLIRPEIPLEKCSNFLDNLSKITKNSNYDIKKHDFLKKNEQKCLILCHGDFNSGNILIKHHKMISVIDFAFVSYSSPLNDISRLIGRLDESYEKLLISEFEKAFETRVDVSDIKNLAQMWNYVDENYIAYIKANHPEISLS